VDYSKAISSDVRELLEKVRKQVVDFNLAYEKLNSEINKIGIEKRALGEFKEEITAKFDHSTKHLESYVSVNIAEFKKTAKEVINLHKELIEVEAIRYEIEKLRDELSKQSADINTALSEFHIRSDRELRLTVQSVQKKVEEEFERESQKIEVRLSMRLKQIDVKYAQLEARILQINGEINALAKNIKQESVSLEQKHEEVKNLSSGYRQEMVQRVGSFETKINTRLQYVEEVMAELEDRLGDGISHFGANSQTNDNTAQTIQIEQIATQINSKTDPIAKELAKVTKQLSEMQKEEIEMHEEIRLAIRKSNLAIWFSASAIILSLVLLAFFRG